ncbi:MAG: hypothetical protein IKG25_05865 [Mogibacterium sp.]|nr:hypothetical protein [Mogibacterium sp.]MBR6037005.1 hypothetical protein [Bacteroidaceae bacterium]MBR6973673.1 hypothetical protein [Bacteroidaceae bacterium]
MATKEKTRVLRTPEMVLTARGHVVNKWCGSCAFKEIQAVPDGKVEGLRHCPKKNIYVEIDDICSEWELEEKIAKL